MATLAPSIISADFRALEASLKRVEPFSSSWHVDVMDGHYVPNLTIGPMVVDAISGASSLPQDVHVMISNVDDTWEWYAKGTVRRIAFHHDQCGDVTKLSALMRDKGIGPGLAVNPDVDVETIQPFLSDVDHLIVMSVYPGFSGQKFIPDVVGKITRFKDLAPDVTVYIDGGVSPSTAQQCVDAGVDVLISASAIFGSDDPPAIAKTLADIGLRR